MKILLINGPNLNLLGKREPSIYGNDGLATIVNLVEDRANELNVTIDHFQSNDEGAIVTRIGEASLMYDGIILNPAAYTHTSVAIRDAISASGLPVIEVHISNIYAREEFRHNSLTAPVCIGQISGLGVNGYILALDGLYNYLISKGEKQC